MNLEEQGNTHSRSNSSESKSTNVTTPDQSAGEDEDVWAFDSDHGNPSGPVSSNLTHDLLSDLPTIRRQHMTDGYREGLSIGIQIALRAGKILGVIEGVLASKGVSDNPQVRQKVQKLYDQAKAELAITTLLKETNDQVINEAKDIPESIDNVLQKWEGDILTSFTLAESQK